MIAGIETIASNGRISLPLRNADCFRRSHKLRYLTQTRPDGSPREDVKLADPDVSRQTNLFVVAARRDWKPIHVHVAHRLNFISEQRRAHVNKKRMWKTGYEERFAL